MTTATSKLRVLNLRFDRRFPTAPAEPQVVTLRPHGQTVLFDCNSLCALQTSPETAARLSSAPGNGLLHCRLKPAVHPGPASVRAACLVLTHRCNLHCPYCFEQQYDDHAADLSLEDARAALGLFPPDGDLSIAFFGGEPLLRFDLVQQVVAEAEALARRRRVGVSFHITTNGTLLTREVAGFLDAHGFGVIVSLDGDEAVHNACRGGHAQTMAGLAHFAGLGLAARTTLRSTFTPGRIELVERLRFLNALVRAGLAANVSVEPVSLPRGHALAFTPQTARGASAEYHAAAQWAVAEVRAGRRPVFFHFDKLAARIATGSPAPTECGAGWHYVTVDPAGRLHACHREGALIGDVHGGIDPDRACPWADNSLRRACSACWLRYVCGGGCRADSLQHCGGGSERQDPRTLPPDPAMCAVKQVIVREVLWMLCELTTEETRRWLDEPGYFASLVGWATWSARFPWHAI